jgi:hypothetical protein
MREMAARTAGVRTSARPLFGRTSMMTSSDNSCVSGT